MAFTYLKLTTFGQTLLAKSEQGKGLHLSRVAIGDGLLGGGSMINRTALVSERFSMLIDAVLLTDESTASAVIATLDNGSFEEGFPFRELAIMGVDPDTSEEATYLYDNAGEECEYLDTQDNGVVIYERMKMLIKVSATDNVTFDPSGNPLYLVAEDLPGVTLTFTEAEARANIVTGETLAVLFGKIKKWLSDLGTAAFSAATDFAAITHQHAATDITSGTLGIARGGTGAGTAAAARTSLGAQATITASGLLKGDGAGGVATGTRGTDYSLVNAPVTATFTAAGWALNATTNCYEQSVAVAGLLTSDDARTQVDPKGNESDPAAQAITDAAYAVLGGEGGYIACKTDGYLYARCPPGSDAPEANFQVYVTIAR